MKNRIYFDVFFVYVIHISWERFDFQTFIYLFIFDHFIEILVKLRLIWEHLSKSNIYRPRKSLTAFYEGKVT